MDSIADQVRRTNPALQPFSFLIGEWRTLGTHPAMPGAELPGRTSFAWHEDGAFLMMRQEVDAPGFPDGLAIIGSDDSGIFKMIYFDERAVSRILDVVVDGQTVTWTHADPRFAQRLELSAEGVDRLVSKGQMSRDSGPWTDDLSQQFDRIAQTERSS